MAKSVKMPENGNVEPYNKREVKDDKKAMKSTAKSVKPVAKDTNKTRRAGCRLRGWFAWSGDGYLSAGLGNYLNR